MAARSQTKKRKKKLAPFLLLPCFFLALAAGVAAYEWIQPSIWAGRESLAARAAGNSALSVPGKLAASKSKTNKKKIIKKAAKPATVGLTGLCKSETGCLTYCMGKRQACLDYCEKDTGNSLCVKLKSMMANGEMPAGDSGGMMGMMMRMMGGSGMKNGDASGASFDPAKEALPALAESNFIDLDRIQRISKFRGGYGHDYSLGTGEKCRSMKHYFWPKGGEPGKPHSAAWMTVRLYAPAGGTIENIQYTEGPNGTEAQFSLRADKHKAFRFGFFHVRLADGLSEGSTVKAGQAIGAIGNEDSFGEIAVEMFTPAGRSLASFFEVASDSVLAAYRARGFASAADVIISRAERDAKPLACDAKTVEGRFAGGSYDGLTDSAGLSNWFELR